jgi:NAD(P)-dependent dehydrogenase (short-subunit alcohol dehydrogenase family)
MIRGRSDAYRSHQVRFFAWQNRTVRHSDGDYLGLHGVRERPSGSRCRPPPEAICAPDYTDAAAVARLFARIDAERGQLDVLVNSAWGPGTPATLSQRRDSLSEVAVVTVPPQCGLKG